MAKLNSDWYNAFRGCFETEEDVIELIFESINTKGWSDSFVDAVGFGEPNEMFKQTKDDKKELLYEFMMSFIKQ
jgi:hypothetical protein